MTMLLIRQKRMKEGWTQEYVGKHTGVSKVAIHDIETGKTKPSHGVLVKLENLFGLSHRELFEEVDGEKVESR